jgi:hypothetical protein
MRSLLLVVHDTSFLHQFNTTDIFGYLTIPIHLSHPCLKNCQTKKWIYNNYKYIFDLVSDKKEYLKNLMKTGDIIRAHSWRAAYVKIWLKPMNMAANTMS